MQTKSNTSMKEPELFALDNNANVSPVVKKWSLARQRVEEEVQDSQLSKKSSTTGPWLVNRFLERQINESSPHKDLSHGSLTCLPRANMEGVISLDLSHNQIKRLDGILHDHWGQLQKLDLSYNQLRCLPETIDQVFINLERLDVSNNELECIPACIWKLRNLNWLNLKNNPKLLKNEMIARACGDCDGDESCFTCAVNIKNFCKQLEWYVFSRELEELSKAMFQMDMEADDLKSFEEVLTFKNVTVDNSKWLNKTIKDESPGLLMFSQRHIGMEMAMNWMRDVLEVPGVKFMIKLMLHASCLSVSGMILLAMMINDEGLEMFLNKLHLTSDFIEAFVDVHQWFQKHLQMSSTNPMIPLYRFEDPSRRWYHFLVLSWEYVFGE